MRVSIFIIALVSLLLWRQIGYPQSLAEAQFLLNIKSAIENNYQKIDMAAMMPGDWELVCESHGYDEPLYLQKYAKTFPVAGSPQDGAWGLIFIHPDGSYKLASGTCVSGVHIVFPNARCLRRAESILIRDTHQETAYCSPTYVSQ